MTLYLSAVANLEAGGGGRASGQRVSSVTSICQPLCLALVNSTSFVNPSHIQTVKTTAHSQSTVCNIALLLNFLCMGNIKFSLCIMHIFNILLYVHAKKCQYTIYYSM